MNSPRPLHLPLVLCALLLALFAPYALQADYPIASHRFLADPAALVHDGRVYFYCSNDDENVTDQEYLMRSLVCISSADLKNWTDHGVVFRVPENAGWAGRSWAPAAVERNGTFYLYFANGASNIGVATSDSPTGPFNDPLGEPLVDHSTPGASGPDMWLFDPYAFIDDDGQAYLYFGGNGESNGRVIKLSEDMISTTGAATSITAPGFFEAAWMHKQNDVYYFSYSTNTANGLRIDYMTSDNPETGFVYGGIVAGQPPLNNNNNHHGIFQFKGSWYHVFHNRVVAYEADIPTVYKRNLGIEPLTHNPDDSIQEITYTRDGLPQVAALNPSQPVEAETFASQSGIETAANNDGARVVTQISHNDYIEVRGVNLDLPVTFLEARAAGDPGGTIEIHRDSLDGPLLATLSVPDTESLQNWNIVTSELVTETLGGMADLFLVFKNSDTSEDFLSLDWWQLTIDDQNALLPPARPFNLTANYDNQAVNLAWSGDPSAQGYLVRRSLNSDGSYPEIIADIPETAFQDANVWKELTYHYSITAYNEDGESLASATDPVAITPFRYPIADTYVQDGDSADSNFGVESILAVEANSAGPDQIAALRFDISGLENVRDANLYLYPESGGEELDTTTIELRKMRSDIWDENVVTWNTLPAPDENLLNDSFLGLEVGVPAANEIAQLIRDELENDNLLSLHLKSKYANASSFVEFASKEHPTESYRPRIEYTFITPPIPSGVFATANRHSISLTWDESEGAESYLVKRATTSEGPYQFINANVSDTVFIDADVEKGTPYYYRIVAANSDSTSFHGPEVTATVPAITYSIWIADQFPDETDPSIIGPRADPDQDQHINLWEYFSGSDPDNPSDSGSLKLNVDSGNRLLITFDKSVDVIGLAYSLLQSSDLKDWSDQGWPASLVSESEDQLRLQFRLPLSTNTKRFYKIQLNQPLPSD